MKLSNGTENFWSQIRNYILSSGVTIIVAFWYYGPKVGSIITFFLFLCFLWLLSDTKSKVLMGLPDEFQYESANLNDYPMLNFTWLQQQTSELEALGFVQLIDYKLVGGNPGFARCFSHPESYCYAEVFEVFQATGESFARQAVISSNLAEGWHLATINREANIKDGISYGFWRNSKSVRTHHPEISFAELLEKHLALRQRMIMDLGITVLTDVSWENYVQLQREGVIYRKRSLRGKIMLLAMIEVTQFELNPKSEWLGDYAKFVTGKVNG